MSDLGDALVGVGIFIIILCGLNRLGEDYRADTETASEYTCRNAGGILKTVFYRTPLEQTLFGLTGGNIVEGTGCVIGNQFFKFNWNVGLNYLGDLI